MMWTIRKLASAEGDAAGAACTPASAMVERLEKGAFEADRCRATDGLGGALNSKEEADGRRPSAAMGESLTDALRP